MAANVFSHGGSAGDTIYHLAPVKDLGGGEFYLNANGHPDFRMPRERIESLLTLIRAQPYITRAGVCETPVGIDLDRWRHNWRHGLNLSDMVSAMLGIPHTSRAEPWLSVPEKKEVAAVVIHRSPRYRVDAFPWRSVVEQYGREAVFVGEETEHRDFTERYGHVSYYRTRTYLELAEVIAGAVLFAGNQSSPAAVAEGLKANKILETVPRDHWAWNCHWERPGVIHGDGEVVELPPLGLWPARRRSVITSDRLELLARLARTAAGLPGEMAELGVYLGGSAMVIADAAPAKLLHLFDTFRGLPGDGGAHHRGDFAAGLEEVERTLSSHRVKFHPGLFPQTARRLGGARFSFVHVDADLYESVRDAITFFWPRLVGGGVLVFDDVDTEDCPGVNQALVEAGLLGRVERTAPRQGFVRKGAAAAGG
jgi:Macrocin-O-methyltransferase (TylF)